jgi:hypothetical protein
MIWKYLLILITLKECSMLLRYNFTRNIENITIE